MKNLVCESLNEFIDRVKREDNDWANTQLDRWETEQKGGNPLEDYVQEIARIIFDSMDKEIVDHTGIDQYIIEDLITDVKLFPKNAYTFYDDSKSPTAAAFELGLSVENYVIETSED